MQTITRKSLLYKSGVEYADYCINHAEAEVQGVVGGQEWSIGRDCRHLGDGSGRRDRRH